jgi:hypothetical protein
MTRIIEDIEAHYETHEVPFGRSYEWHPEYIIVECDCGQKLAITATSNIPTCPQCGLDYSSLLHDLRHHHREEQLRDEDIHPWHYDEQSQADQHLRDEDACTGDSPWRYNDVTSGFVGDDEERCKQARAQQARPSLD